MKHAITISVNGKPIKKSVAVKDYNWDFYEKVYEGAIAEYLGKGYTSIRSASGSERSYNVLLNEDDMTSAVVSAAFYTETDFNDADGKPIRIGEMYRSDETNDRYTVNKNPWKKNALYIRNIDRWESHVETVNGRVQMSQVVKDVNDFDQAYIDSLKIHKI